MILNYKTAKLPYNFIFVGFFLFVYSVWLFWAGRYYLGISFLLVSLPCLFTRLGTQIDTTSKRFREYIGFFSLRYGTWKDFSGLEKLVIGYMMESEMMTHKSLAANYTVKNYKLYMRVNDQDLEILSGKKEFIQKSAKDIAKELNVEIIE